MQELNIVEVDAVGGGILFVIVPAWIAYGVIATELAIIAGIAAKQ